MTLIAIQVRKTEESGHKYAVDMEKHQPKAHAGDGYLLVLPTWYSYSLWSLKLPTLYIMSFSFAANFETGKNHTGPFSTLKGYF